MNIFSVPGPCLTSGLKPFPGHVGSGDLVHDDEGADGRAECRQVPGVSADRGGEPGGAEAEEEADAAQQVRNDSRRGVVAFEFGQ